MGKYILLAIVLLGVLGRVLLNIKNKSGIGNAAKKLAKGKLTINDLASKLDIALSTLNYKAGSEPFTRLLTLNKGLHKIHSRSYQILATKYEGNRAVIIASVTGTKDSQYANDDMKITLPASLLLEQQVDSNSLTYYAECPTDSEHEQYIIDFINHIHSRLAA